VPFSFCMSSPVGQVSVLSAEDGTELASFELRTQPAETKVRQFGSQFRCESIFDFVRSARPSTLKNRRPNSYLAITTTSCSPRKARRSRYARLPLSRHGDVFIARSFLFYEI